MEAHKDALATAFVFGIEPSARHSEEDVVAARRATRAQGDEKAQA